MNDEDFHHMMAAQDENFFNTFSDQVFLFNELDTSYTDTCSMALLDEPLENMKEEGIQSTSRPSNVQVSKTFSESFDDEEEVLAITEREENSEQGQVHEVSILSDNEQVKRFIMGIIEDECDEYCDAESYLDSDDEYMLAEEGKVEESNLAIVLQKYNALVALGQKEDVDSEFIRDIYKIENTFKGGIPRQYSFTMEDKHEPETSEDSLRGLSMRETYETTETDEEQHAPKTLEVACDPSRIADTSERADQSVTTIEKTETVSRDPLGSGHDVPSQRSANTACVGSSSSDLKLREVGLCSELIESSNVCKFYDMSEESDEENKLWSILTNRPCYLKTPGSSSIGFRQAEDPKSLLFNADKSNIPKLRKQFERERKELL